MKFNTGGKAPVSIGWDLPTYEVEASLNDVQKAALTEDLK
jgi:hypothetical protein